MVIGLPLGWTVVTNPSITRRSINGHRHQPGCSSAAQRAQPGRWLQSSYTTSLDVTSAQFIPVAETSGPIIDIGTVILFKDCRAAAAFTTPITVSVNLSAVQFFRVDILKLVSQTLATTGLAPNQA
ncbi:MAG: hypothetical protein NTZ14_06080 [Hyphomicrobiales bacterium]|nr:hypothetical protein [Hyphomicrobiales bacterium]